MKNKKFWLLVVVIIAVGVVWQIQREPVNTFTNTRYRYSVEYPLEVRAITNNIYARDLAEEPEVEFFIPGSGTVFTVEVWPQNPTINPKLSEPEQEFYRDRNRLVSLNLKDFAEELRQAQLADKNPNIPDKEVGELERGSVDRREAYGFTLTGSFVHGPDGSLGYSIPGNAVYAFKFLEGVSGEKFILRYPISRYPTGSRTAAKMLGSFKWLD